MTQAQRRVGNIVAMLAAVAMFFSTLEYLIPKPVPFFRVGLANIPLLLVLDSFKTRHVLLLALLKVVGQGLVHGTLASYVFLFSLSGTVASTLCMIAAVRLTRGRVSLVAVSTLGAAASNALQVSLSVVFVFGSGSWIIAPPFLIVGTIAGAVVGAIAQHFVRVSTWAQTIRDDYAASQTEPT